jgi:hypothetical protein
MKAFPNKEIIFNTLLERDVTRYHRGMDLRDYFAAQVLSKVMEQWPSADFTGASEIAYEYADAMIKVRSV